MFELKDGSIEINVPARSLNFKVSNALQAMKEFQEKKRELECSDCKNNCT